MLNYTSIAGGPMFQRALKLALWPAFISVFVTLARFFSERAELPNPVSMAIGIAWLTLIVGVYLGIRLAEEKRPSGLLFLTLLVFAVLSRIPVVIMWWVTKTYELGTHYDVFQTWGSALAAQFVFGVIQQVITGGLFGLAALYLKRRSGAVPENTVASGQ
jgi:hypothetical protein